MLNSFYFIDLSETKAKQLFEENHYFLNMQEHKQNIMEAKVLSFHIDFDVIPCKTGRGITRDRPGG